LSGEFITRELAKDVTKFAPLIFYSNTHYGLLTSERLSISNDAWHP